MPRSRGTAPSDRPTCTAGATVPSIVVVDDRVAGRQEGGGHLVVHPLVELEGRSLVTAPSRVDARDVDAEAGAGRRAGVRLEGVEQERRPVGRPRRGSK